MKKTIRTSFILIFFCISTITQAFTIHPKPYSQGNDPERKAKELLSQMTPAEKVGQLFLVSFSGNEIAQDLPIYDMIVNHHVGGVILNRRNDNFTSENTILNSQKSY